jgi:hypothetical protein
MSSEPGLIPQSSGTIELDRAQTEHIHQAYERWVYEHRQKTFIWHARSTRIIFWLSMFVAISGLGLSFWQFVASAKEAEKAIEENELTIKTELISLAFKSRSIAALILFLSIAYLTLYALLIYPLRELNGSASQGASNAKEYRGALDNSSGGSRVNLNKDILEAASNQPPER